MYAMVKMDLKNISNEKYQADVSGLVVMEVKSLDDWKNRILQNVTFTTHTYVDIHQGQERHFIPDSQTLMEALSFIEIDSSTFNTMKTHLRSMNNGTAYWCLGCVPRFLVL